MRIGFSGTHSTGKTTLLEQLRGVPEFEGYEFDVNVTRWIRGLGLPINQGTSDDSQEINMARRLAALVSNPKLIADRTTYDVFAYSLFSNSGGGVSDESIQRQLVWFTKSIHEYDHVFYIPPEIELEADGTRSEDEAYRIAIDATLKKLYNFAIETAKWNKIPCKIHKISGSVDERISQILNILAINDWSE